MEEKLHLLLRTSSVNCLVLFLYRKDKLGYLSFAYWFTESLSKLLTSSNYIYYIQIF